MVKRKHIFESIVIVETVIIIIVAIFMFAGYPISLMLNGFAPQNSEILYAGIDDNENERWLFLRKLFCLYGKRTKVLVKRMD